MLRNMLKAPPPPHPPPQKKYTKPQVKDDTVISFDYVL